MNTVLITPFLFMTNQVCIYSSDSGNSGQLRVRQHQSIKGRA